MPTLEGEILDSGLFESITMRRYRQDVTHTPESYTDLLLTFSDHIAQPEPIRTNLLSGIEEVIRNLPGGLATKTHLIILHVAKRRAE